MIRFWSLIRDKGICCVHVLFCSPPAANSHCRLRWCSAFNKTSNVTAGYIAARMPKSMRHIRDPTSSRSSFQEAWSGSVFSQYFPVDYYQNEKVWEHSEHILHTLRENEKHVILNSFERNDRQKATSTICHYQRMLLRFHQWIFCFHIVFSKAPPYVIYPIYK